MLGENIKVHFAGSDNSLPHYLAMQLAGVNYSLFTCYGFIEKKEPDSKMKFSEDQLFIPKVIEKQRKNVIMDSGLFTLMFGAGKNKKLTLDDLIKWQDTTASFLHQNKLSCMCVEIDCQKLLGVKEAWFLRERMKKVMPNNRHINVWHLEDGKKGLDRLIEYSDYIAISVPELRIQRRGRHGQVTIQLANYIKNKKPEIDIHLLGCTEIKILEQTRFCTSSDSTAWLKANKHGTIYHNKKTYHVNHIADEQREKITPSILELYEKVKPPAFGAMTEKTLKYTQDAYFSVLLNLNRYIKACGSQK